MKVDNFLLIKDIPSHLVKSQRPVRLHDWGLDDTSVVLADDVCRLWATQKVKIETAADGPVENIVRAEQPILSMSIPSIDTMRSRGTVFISCFQVHRMRAMSVDIWELIIVQIICIPKRLCKVVA